MSSNAFKKLAALVPDAPVLVGLVIEHNDDDTSTVQLPTNQPLTNLGGVARGSLIRPRGRKVPVGSWAFVRRGVVETQAPPLGPSAVAVGPAPAPPPAPTEWLLDTFTGPYSRLTDRTGEVGAAWSVYSTGNFVYVEDGSAYVPVSSLGSSAIGRGMYRAAGAPSAGAGVYYEGEVVFTTSSAGAVELFVTGSTTYVTSVTPTDGFVLTLSPGSGGNVSLSLTAGGYILDGFNAGSVGTPFVVRAELSADRLLLVVKVNGATVGTYDFAGVYAVVGALPTIAHAGMALSGGQGYIYTGQGRVSRVAGGYLT